jgi:hypothetical protein
MSFSNSLIHPAWMQNRSQKAADWLFPRKTQENQYFSQTSQNYAMRPDATLLYLLAASYNKYVAAS